MAHARARPKGLSLICAFGVMSGILSCCSAGNGIAWSTFGGNMLTRAAQETGGPGAHDSTALAHALDQQRQLARANLVSVAFQLAYATLAVTGAALVLTERRRGRQVFLAALFTGLSVQLVTTAVGLYVRARMLSIERSLMLAVPAELGGLFTPYLEFIERAAWMTMAATAALAMIDVVYYLVGLWYFFRPEVRAYFRTVAAGGPQRAAVTASGDSDRTRR
ncbi:MAG: hypothetical protein KC543_04200 [Myxococcales bacterium]|nr:hypothetical protein [Myxococcales bacterium]